MIPKIIHQLWIGPKKPPLDLMRSWRELHPEWRYVLWNEQTLAAEFPGGLENQPQYDAMPEWCGKCDIARYEILRRFGGFFVDADARCLRPLEDYFLENDSFSCYESELLRGQLIAVGYLGCIPGCALMTHLISRIGRLQGASLHQGPMTAWKTVGPLLLTQTVRDERYVKLAIYPSFYFIPTHYTRLCGYDGPFRPYAQQYWGSTITPQGKVGMTYDD